MAPVVVGLAAVEVIRKLGTGERRVVAANIDNIRRAPGEAGIPSGDELRPPNTWHHVCPGSTFAVYYRWSSQVEEQLALDSLLESVGRDAGAATGPGAAAAGVEIVDVRSFYAL